MHIIVLYGDTLASWCRHHVYRALVLLLAQPIGKIDSLGNRIVDLNNGTTSLEKEVVVVNLQVPNLR